jgi:hypothetical protein
LPAIGPVIGRSSRLLGLPDGTMRIIAAVLGALEALPPDLSRNLRQYRLHQHRTGFELLLGRSAPLPRALYDHIEQVWRRATAPAITALCFTEMDFIPQGSLPKYFQFTSDFIPGDERVKPPAP